jgi:hypothetical protein
MNFLGLLFVVALVFFVVGVDDKAVKSENVQKKPH